MSAAIPILSMLGNFAQILTATIFTIVKLVFRCEFIHTTSDREDFPKIQSWIYEHHTNSSWYIDGTDCRMPGGLVIGKKGYRPFVIWVSGPPEAQDKEKGAPKMCKDIFIITWVLPNWADKNSFEKDGTRITQSESENTNSNIPSKISINILQPVSAWVGDRFREMKMHVFPVAKQWQLNLYEEVKNISNKREMNYQTPGSVILLQGPPGTGKTEAAKVIAAKMYATLVPDFDPTRAGHWLASLVKIAEPTAEKPLVIVMDEVDGIIKRILDGESFSNQVKWLFLQVSNKKSWNQFFDNLHKNYEHVHFILTSNTTIDNLKLSYGECWDASLMRIGRLDAVFTVGEGYKPEDRENILPTPIKIDYVDIVSQKLERYNTNSNNLECVVVSKEDYKKLIYK